MADRYWLSAYGRIFCAVFGWIGHAWVPVIRGFDPEGMIAGRQCRRCWRSEDCTCHRCANEDYRTGRSWDEYERGWRGAMRQEHPPEAAHSDGNEH